MITSIVAAVVIFATLVLVHEAGHFAMAKRLGVRVIRFSIGYPPRVWGIRRGETEYSIGATPLGGYVRMLGDEVAEEPSAATIEGYIKEIELDLLDAARKTGWLAASGKSGDDALVAIADAFTQGSGAGTSLSAILGREPNAEEAILLREIARAGSVARARESLSEGRPSALVERFNLRAFPSQKLWKRIAIVLAGPAANILFAPIVLTLVFMIGVPVTLPVIGQIFPDKPGAAAGLRTGDGIVSVDGTPIATWDDLSHSIRESGGKALQLIVKRPAGSNNIIKLTVQPALTDEETPIFGGKTKVWIIGVLPHGDETTKHETPLVALQRGVAGTWHISHDIVVGIVKIIDGTTSARKALGGPIMIAQMAGKEAHEGFADVAMFTVMLSLELGIINLLPVPLLDGGHLAFFVIEAIRGKPLKLRHREIAMQVGLFLLFILMSFVILNDISRLIG
ncbi:MAG TPA: RIP metalloprotease RseP [Candidatus Binataceae bacterium]|jgi:regulator of sigma E protease